MQLNEAPDERQPDPQAPSRSLAVLLDLREHLENSFELVGRHANAAVSDEDNGLALLLCGGQPDTAAGFRVLTRVVEEIAEHLRQSHGIGIQINRLVRQRHIDPLLVALSERAAGLDRMTDDRSQLDPCLLELKLVPRNAADVEQIVDETDHVR